MPYIKQEDRVRFTAGIKEIENLFITDGKNLKPGDVNYVFSKIIYDVFDANPSYTLGNNLIGALECIKTEFYRRRLESYENEKIKENGDI